MTNNTDSKELIPPIGEPWMSHGFISKIAAQVSLPYRNPKGDIRTISKTNGTLTVRYTATGDYGLPYGKYPRLFEMWVCTMIKTGNPCFNPETNTINLGSTFREFLKLIGVQVGGSQLKNIKRQLESLFSCAYTITNNTDSQSIGVSWTVAKEWHIDWLRDETQSSSGPFENWVRLSPEYIDMLRDYPVPVDLKVIAALRKPMAIDIYWWLTKRVYNLHEPANVTWQQLYQQFGSDSELKDFKRKFKRALADVLDVYPCNVAVGPQRVTIFPSQTSIPTVSQTKAAERQSRLEQLHDSRSASAKAADPKDTGHWQTFDVYWKVFTTYALFDVNVAREHRDGLISLEECRFCKFDQRNEDHHGETPDAPLL